MQSTTHDDGARAWILAIGLIASVMLHAAGLSWAQSHPLRLPVIERPLDFQLVPVELPKPPAPAPVVKTARPTVKLAAAPKPKSVETPAPPQPVVEAAPPTPLVFGLHLPAGPGKLSVPSGNAPNGPLPHTGDAPVAQRGCEDSAAEVISELRIPYPDDARRAGIGGTVRLRLSVDAEGHVTDAKVISGLGAGLDEAAVEAVRKFRFRPAMHDCAAVPSTLIHAYTFVLD
jgi:protein TonB